MQSATAGAHVSRISVPPPPDGRPTIAPFHHADTESRLHARPRGTICPPIDCRLRPVSAARSRTGGQTLPAGNSCPSRAFSTRTAAVVVVHGVLLHVVPRPSPRRCTRSRPGHPCRQARATGQHETSGAARSIIDRPRSFMVRLTRPWREVCFSARARPRSQSLGPLADHAVHDRRTRTHDDADAESTRFTIDAAGCARGSLARRLRR